MTEDNLIEAACAARARAHAPYSRFCVGAAILDREGRVFCGANIENISFGLTICAERVAVAAAIIAGSRQFAKLAIVADSHEPIMPCGACRQVIAEFAPNLEVVSATTTTGKHEHSTMSVLLPCSRQGILEKFHVEQGARDV